MKRVLKIVCLVVLVPVLAIVGLLVATFAGTPPIPDGMDLPGGARVVKDGYVSVFVLPAGPDAVALIDAGNDRQGGSIRRELSRRGLGPEAVKAIFLTHGHPDHVSACHLFPQAAVLALPGDIDLAEGRSAAASLIGNIMGRQDRQVHVTRPLRDGETVTVGDLAVEVFAVPGHTAGSAAYLTRGVLFLGDSADARRDGSMAGSKRIVSDDRDQNRASLQSLAQKLKGRAAEIQVLAFAHSGVLTGFSPLGRFAGL